MRRRERTRFHSKTNIMIIGSSLLVLILLTSFIYYKIFLAQSVGVYKNLWIDMRNTSKTEKHIPVRIEIAHRLILEEELDSVIGIYKRIRLYEGKQLIKVITHNKYIDEDSIDVGVMSNHTLDIEYLDSAKKDRRVSVEYKEMFTD
jgi:hypothetical protein